MWIKPVTGTWTGRLVNLSLIPFLATEAGGGGRHVVAITSSGSTVQLSADYATVAEAESAMISLALTGVLP